VIELEHSPLGGSGASRFLACAGSFLLHRELYEAGELETIESDFAKLGTAAHEVAARCLQEEREPFEFIGQEFGGYKVGDPDGINPNAVAVYVNHCESIMPRDGKGKTLIETTLAHPDVHPYLKGTVDFGYWSSKRGLFLRDYKNGEGIGVGAVNNQQLLYYAFLMLLEFKWLGDAPADFPVSLGIVQPNFYGVFEEPDVWETNVGTVLEWGNNALLPRMNELVVTRDIGKSDFVSGKHCQFCPVLLDCPRMQDNYLKFASGDQEFTEMLTDEELHGFFSLRDDAMRFKTALEATVKARLVAGSEIPSAKLVETRTSRIWKPGAEVALKTALGEHAYEARKVKSPAQIEKLSTRGKEMVAEWGYKPEASKLSLAGIDDPRPAAKGTANERVFAGFEQDVTEGF
jgi:hypothetical protein